MKYQLDLAFPPKFILVTTDSGFDFNEKCKNIGISKVVNKNMRGNEILYALEDVIAEIETETPEYRGFNYN